MTKKVNCQLKLEELFKKTMTGSLMDSLKMEIFTDSLEEFTIGHCNPNNTITYPHILLAHTNKDLIMVNFSFTIKIRQSDQYNNTKMASNIDFFIYLKSKCLKVNLKN